MYSCRKCRCEPCKQANSEYMKQWRAQNSDYKRNLLGHGRNGYRAGCRCEVCSAANREYMKQWRERNTDYESRRTQPAELTHGLVGTYDRWGCRCLPCVKAAAEARKDYKNRNRETVNAKGRRACAARRARKRNNGVIPFSEAQLRQRWTYYGGRCWMCGVDADCTDHVKPLARGGSHILCNLRPACTPCNNSKKDAWAGPSLQRTLW